MPVEVSEVRRIVEDELDSLVKESHCPKCKGITTMLKVAFSPDVECNLNPEQRLVRCMRCLSLYSIELVDQGKD